MVAMQTSSQVSRQFIHQYFGFQMYHLSNFDIFLKFSDGKIAAILEHPVQALKFVAKNIKSFLGLGLAGIAVGVNLKINSQFFDCPGKNYQPYGYMFLFAPCVFLLFVGMIIVRVHPKRLMNAIAQQKPGTSKFGTFRNVINPALSRPLAAPFAWLIVSLAQADYFVCATVGPGPEKRRNLTITEANDLTEKIEEYKGYSQIAAWGVLMVAALWAFKVIALQDDKEGSLITHLVSREGAVEI